MTEFPFTVTLNAVIFHPSVPFCHTNPVPWYEQAKQGIPDAPLPSNNFQLLLGDPSLSLKPDEICNLFSEFWLCSLVFSQLNVPRKPSKEWDPGGILIRCLHHLSWLLLHNITQLSIIMHVFVQLQIRFKSDFFFPVKEILCLCTSYKLSGGCCGR